MEDSIFTKIIKGEIPCHKVYEDDRTIAFLDIHPVNPGHILVVPKQQVANFEELDEETFLHLMSVVRALARHTKEVLQCPRVGLVVAGFDVPHVHVHVIPAYKAADVPIAQHVSVEPDHEALSVMAKRIAI